jgi:hypothetical protein
LQKVITAAAHKVRHRQFLSSFNLHDPTVTQTDFIRAHSHGNPALILLADLSKKYNRMPAHSYVSFARTDLMLPQIPHLGCLEPSPFDYKAERCLNDHRGNVGEKAFLDAGGDHANSGCPPCSYGMHARHKLIIWVLYYLAQEAGCEVDLEPATSAILNGEYTDEECRHMFPKKHISKAKLKELDALRSQLEQHKKLPAGDARAGLINSNLASQAIIIGCTDGESTVGLRLDVRLMDPVSNQEFFIDATCISPTCSSKREAELKHTLKRLSSAVQAKADLAPDPEERNTSAAVTAAEKFKHTKYARLLAVATAQHAHRLRPSLPVFHAFVMSTLGELGPGSIAVQEFLLACYARRLRREGPRRDGLTKSFLTAQFRSKLRIGLQVAVAKGCAQMSLNAGLPTLKKRRAAIDQHIFITPKPRMPRIIKGPRPVGIRPKHSNNIKGNKPPSLIELYKTPSPARTQPKTLDCTPRAKGPSPRTFADFVATFD